MTTASAGSALSTPDEQLPPPKLRRLEQPKPVKWPIAVTAAGLSGMLLAGCFAPWGQHYLAWIALVPLFLVLPRLRPTGAWLVLGLCGLVFYRLALGWMFGLSGPHGAFLIGALATLFGLAGCITRISMQRWGPRAILWAAPLWLTGQEILRCEALPRFRFAYAALGYSQASNPWIAQLASLGGVYFLSLLIVAVNAALAWALLQRTCRAWLWVTVLSVAILLLPLTAQPSPSHHGETVRVACVQVEAFDYDGLAELTATAFTEPPTPQLVVLPEHTVLDYADENHHFIKQLTHLARQHEAYITVGAHVEAEDTPLCLFDNTALTVGPDGIVNCQPKAVPIPFFIHDGNPAQRQTTFTTPHGRMGALVCYDAGFTDIARRTVAAGAELLLVPVMNPKDWPEAQRLQQANMARIRSIEQRRSAVRAASSGVSQIIDHTGRVLTQRPQADGPGIIHGTLPLRSERTLFNRGGYLLNDILGWAFLVAAPLLLAVESLREWRYRKARQTKE